MVSHAIQSLPEPLAEKLREVVERVTSRAQAQLIILFGSHAEGRAGPESDVDLVVVVDTPDWHRTSVDLSLAVRPVLSPYPCDLLVYTKEGWEHNRHIIGFVARDADRGGVRLYEAP